MAQDDELLLELLLELEDVDELLLVLELLLDVLLVELELVLLDEEEELLLDDELLDEELPVPELLLLDPPPLLDELDDEPVPELDELLLVLLLLLELELDPPPNIGGRAKEFNSWSVVKTTFSALNRLMPSLLEVPDAKTTSSRLNVHL